MLMILIIDSNYLCDIKNETEMKKYITSEHRGLEMYIFYILLFLICVLA